MKRLLPILCLAIALSAAGTVFCAEEESVAPIDHIRLEWKDNILAITADRLPGGRLEVWYLEAFCRGNSTHREWQHTTIPHKTRLLEADPEGRWVRLENKVEPHGIVKHHIQAKEGQVNFRMKLTNQGKEPSEIVWLQPCVRVDRFTGRDQEGYIDRSFIFVDGKRTMLDETRRTEEAMYRGGQVYVPEGIPLEDVNPRPISPDRPSNALIGCISENGKYLFATAWSNTQELFQGVIVCLHNDPRIGGLAPGESKELKGVIYLLPNDEEELLRRHRRDF